MALEGMRVAVLAADGFEQVELTVPVKRLRHLGAQVEILSLRPGRIRGMNGPVPGKRIKVDRTVYSARPEQFDALFLPGGYISPDALRQNERVLEFVRAFDATGKPIAFICHAAWILISAGLVDGRKLTSWPGIRPDVENAGGEWRDKAIVQQGNWVSSRGPEDLPRFRRALARHFARQVEPASDEVTYRAPKGGRVLLATAVIAAVGAGVWAWFWRPRARRGGTASPVSHQPTED